MTQLETCPECGNESLEITIDGWYQDRAVGVAGCCETCGYTVDETWGPQPPVRRGFDCPACGSSLLVPDGPAAATCAFCSARFVVHLEREYAAVRAPRPGQAPVPVRSPGLVRLLMAHLDGLGVSGLRAQSAACHRCGHRVRAYGTGRVLCQRCQAETDYALHRVRDLLATPDRIDTPLGSLPSLWF